MAASESRLLASAQPDVRDVILVPSSPILPSIRPVATDTPTLLRKDGQLEPPTAGGNALADAPKTALSKPTEYLVIGSTPDSAAKITPEGFSSATGNVQTYSKYFAGSQAASRAAEVPTYVAEKYGTGDLEHAVRRRRDWTPPPTDTVVLPGCGSSPAPEQWSSPSMLAGRKDVFKSLHNSFGCKPDEEVPSNSPATTAGNNSFVKRKPIEAITIGDAGQAVDKTSPVKTKAPKKKTRTLTELAVAAYADASSTTNTTVPAKKQAATKRQLNLADEAVPVEDPECRPGHPNSKLRKLKTIRQTATKKGKTKRAARPPKPVLLSPQSARAESMRQDFLFGTSSQLATEQSPTFLRHLHEAMQASNQENGLVDFFTGASTVDLTSHTEGHTKLWGAAARAEDGNLTFDNVIDLEDAIEFPEDPHQVIEMAQRAAEEARLTRLGSANSGFAKGVEPLAQVSGGRNKILATQSKKVEQQPSHSDSTNNVEPRCSQPAMQPVSSTIETATISRPNFDVLTTVQLAKKVSSYGYKAMRGRSAMVALLNQCWEAQNLPSAGQLAQSASMYTTATQSITTGHVNGDKLALGGQSLPEKAPAQQPLHSPSKQPKSQRSSKTKATKSAQATSSASAIPLFSFPKSTTTFAASTRAEIHTTTKVKAKATTYQAQEGPDDRLILEIEDSESDGRFSSPEVPCSVASENETDMPEDEVDLSLAETLTCEESELFMYITNAVVNAPRTDDAANPSWHEKILMYDTIILETFTAWLNDGQLLAAGFEGNITPVEVKKWCESKSVCCTWRKNLHGKERKI